MTSGGSSHLFWRGGDGNYEWRGCKDPKFFKSFRKPSPFLFPER